MLWQIVLKVQCYRIWPEKYYVPNYIAKALYVTEFVRTCDFYQKSWYFLTEFFIFCTDDLTTRVDPNHWRQVWSCHASCPRTFQHVERRSQGLYRSTAWATVFTEIAPSTSQLLLLLSYCSLALNTKSGRNWWTCH